MASYTVVSGDYGIRIAQQYTGDGSRWVELKPLNPEVVARADPTNTGFPIYIGDVLTIPDDWGTVSSSAPAVCSMPGAYWAATEDNVDGYSPEAGEWDSVWLGGECLPGVWRVSVELEPDIEVKKAKGQAGAAITDQGDNPTKVHLRGQFYDRAHWEKWQALVPALFAKKSNAERTPLAIEHPQTACYGISVVYVTSLSAEDPDEDVMAVAIDAIEWTPKPPDAKTSGKAKTNPADVDLIGVAQEADAIVRGNVAAIAPEAMPDWGYVPGSPTTAAPR